MSKNHRQRRRRLPSRVWPIVFKTVVALGQVAYFVVKIFLRE